MSNRSHRNAGHMGMNRLRKQGLLDASARAITSSETATCHVIAVGDWLDVLRRIPSGTIQLVICDPPYNINVAGWDDLKNYVEWAGRWLGVIEGALEPSGN